MIRLEEKYTQAIEFRKRGFTYSEIAKIVDVSKSTVSVWFSGKAFSKRVKADNQKRAAKDNVKRIGLINKARKAERITRYSEAVHAAETEYKHYKKDPLFTAGLMLYVGFGEKTTKHRVSLCCNDMQVHKVFLSFAFEYLGIPKESVHFWLLLYPQVQEKKAVSKWCKTLGLSKENLYKNQQVQGVIKSEALQHGIGNTIIGGTILKLKLSKWVELALAELP